MKLPSIQNAPPYPQNGLFIFHRDLRIVDNIGLQIALETCSKVYTVFIFTPEQVSSSNSYKSKNCVQFMIESLADLASDIRKYRGELIVCYGHSLNITKMLIEKLNIHVVFYNKDYSPYALKRDNEVFDMCVERGVYCIDASDYYLYEPGSVVTGSGGAYKKYTPFLEAVIGRKPTSPQTLGSISVKLARLSRPHVQIEHKIMLSTAMKNFVGTPNKNILIKGGRKNGMHQLHKALRTQSHYNTRRDYFTYETTFLSAYLKFGCVSVREVYYSVVKKYGKTSGIIRELIWREFFAHVLYSYPEVLKGSYQPSLKHIPWNHNSNYLKKWKEGQTGFPLVDACMTQMNTTGYMHNRGRMLVASFLCKVLLLNWRLGEQYFAQQLTDYDPASNNGNWQGISGTGVDMKPYFRDMNPWIQSEKFDPEAEYIKKWIPELKDVSPEHIHKWHEHYKDEAYKNVKYQKPMVDYYIQKEKMLKMYKDA